MLSEKLLLSAYFSYLNTLRGTLKGIRITMWSFWIHTPLVVTRPGVVTPKKVRRPPLSLLYGGTSTEMYIAYINCSRLFILLRSLKRAPKNMQMWAYVKFSLTKTSSQLVGTVSCMGGIPRFPHQSVWLSLYFLDKFFHCPDLHQ